VPPLSNSTWKLSYRKDDRAMRPTYGALQIFESCWRPRVLFPKFFTGFVQIYPMNVHTKFEVRSFTRSWDNSDWSFGGCEPTILVKRRPQRVGDGTIRKSVSDFILYSNFSSIFTRFRDIAAFELQHATFTTQISLPKISPCSPGSRWKAIGLRRAKYLKT